MANIIGSMEAAQQPRKTCQPEVQDVLNTFSSRRAKLRDWIQKAWAFYNQQHFEGFVLLLENALTRGNKSYTGHKDDLLTIHTMLSAHFIRLACSEHGQRRAMWQERVSQQLAHMDSLQLVSNELQPLLCRGYALMLAETRLPDADNCFAAVLRQKAHNVPALLGRACLAYNRQDYRCALGYFKSVLLHQPHGPADLRVGIAHCFLQLGDLDSARRAFELALARNGRCINALLGMAQLKLNERQRAANMEATNLLCAAYELNCRHPVVLSWLACYLYYSRNYDKLQTAAGNAYLITDNALLKAQNCFQIARSFHATKNYERAFDFYGKAVKCQAEYAPPHLGLAQMYVRRGQLDMAEHALRSLLKLLPEQPLGLRMLGTLYARAESPGKWDKAIQLFRCALERDARDDYDSWLGLAATYERQQLWQPAIDAYEQAISIYLRLKRPLAAVPLAWLNNKAALQMHAGLKEAALQTLDQALAIKSEEAEESEECAEASLLTVRFNRARVLEELHLADQAEASYKQLISEYPSYYDSYLRLGVMASRRNQNPTALECFKAVLQLDNENVAARIFVGNYYAKQGALSQAMFNYNVIMRRPGSFGDSYMLVAVGNVCLIKVQRCTAAGQLTMARQYQENALQLFRKALEQNQRNVWAANGIGVALSKYGHLADGEAIFKQIVESSKRCSAALLNSAHIALKLEHYAEAIECYKQCLEGSLPVNSVREMQLLASAFYELGRFNEAKSILMKARHVAPQEQSLLYNLALSMQQQVRNTLDTKRSELEELRTAEQQLKLAQSFFQCVDQKEDSLRLAHKQANKCSQLLDIVWEQLKGLRENESEERQKRHQKDYTRKDTERPEYKRRREHSKRRHEKHAKVKSTSPAKVLDRNLEEPQEEFLETVKKHEKSRSHKRRHKAKKDAPEETNRHGKKHKKDSKERKHKRRR